MCAAILAMIVIDDDDPAADEHIISNLDKVRCGDMHKLADANVTPDGDSWCECLVVIAGNCFEPQPCLGREVVPNAN